MGIELYHGGAPDLGPGDFILPPSVTGSASCSDYGAAGIHRRDRVYLCADMAGAVLFAAGHPSGRGVVYAVEPIGILEPDPDCTEIALSFQCSRARIIRRIKLRGKTRKLALKALLTP